LYRYFHRDYYRNYYANHGRDRDLYLHCLGICDSYSLAHGNTNQHGFADPDAVKHAGRNRHTGRIAIIYIHANSERDEYGYRANG
jgi:hypothetical protein